MGSYPSLLTVHICVYAAFCPLYWLPNNCRNASRRFDVCPTRGDKVAVGVCHERRLQLKWTRKVHWGQQMLLVNSGLTKVDAWSAIEYATHFQRELAHFNVLPQFPIFFKHFLHLFSLHTVFLLVYKLTATPPCSGYHEIFLIMLWFFILFFSLKWSVLHGSITPGRPSRRRWFQVALQLLFVSALCTWFNRALSCSTVGLIKACGCCGNWGNTDAVCWVAVWPFCVGFSTGPLTILTKPCCVESVFSHLLWDVMVSQCTFSLRNVNF